MHTLLMRLAAAALILSAPALAGAAALERAFVAFHDELPANIAAEMTLSGITEGRVIPTINAVDVTAPRVVLETWARDPRVRAVTQQRRIDLHLYASRDQIGAGEVQDAEAAGDQASLPAFTGAGVTVAIIDSGIFLPHPDFGLPGASRVIAGANFEFTLIQRESGVLPADVWDSYASGSEALALQDEVGHGTHVAGTVAGDGFAASGLDMRGVAPGASLVSLKIASAGNGVVEDVGFEANAVAAIDYLIRHREELGNVRVANNSWGLLEEEAQGLLGPTDFDAIREVVRAAVEAGIVFVFSAGNDGPGPETVRPIPNGMDEVITVAAACKDRDSCAPGTVAGFSSRGPSVDITAPGANILSASSPSILEPLGQIGGTFFGDSLQDELQNRVAYAALSGTSMASPHIAGVVALMLEANPELTPAEVKEILLLTADDMALEGNEELVPGFDNASGFGLANSPRAVAMAAARKNSGSAPAAPRNAGTASQGGAGGPLLLLVLLTALVARRR